MPKTILLIEDEKILGEMYQEKFTQAGFQVEWTKEAESGLEMAKRLKPDLIVLDILLPRGNGVAFLKGLRKDPEISSLRVVAFSTLDDPVIKKEAFALGIKDYLIKTNYTPQEITEKIREYLQ